MSELVRLREEGLTTEMVKSFLVYLRHAQERESENISTYLSAGELLDLATEERERELRDPLLYFTLLDVETAVFMTLQPKSFEEEYHQQLKEQAEEELADAFKESLEV